MEVPTKFLEDFIVAFEGIYAEHKTIAEELITLNENIVKLLDQREEER